MRIRAVVFDLDGTLVDSAPGLQTAANAVLAEHGCAPLGLQEVEAMIGDGIPALIGKAFAHSGRALDWKEKESATESFRRIYARCGPRETLLYPGARESLKQLSSFGLVFGLCTNKPQKSTEPLLKALKIDHFFSAVCGGDVLPEEIRKPDPRHALAVLAGLGIDASEAVMVGDGPHDVDSGQGAGMPVFVVTYGYSHGSADTLGADFVIDSLTELPEYLEYL